MSTLGLRINNDFPRPESRQVQCLVGLPVANLADCMNRLACADSGLRPFNRAPLLGPALTVRATGGDNLVFYKALQLARPGEVIVVAGGGLLNRAYCGEIMVRLARQRQLGGFVIDGCIRDAEAISQLDFPVYARGVSPNGPFKNGPGELGYPVSVAGLVINPGDILVGDGDGLVAIPPAEAETLAEETRAVGQKEAALLASIEAGAFDDAWVDAMLESKGYAIR